MRKLIILVLVAVMLAAMLTGGCAKPAPSPAPTPTPVPEPPKTLDIGVAIVLTGPTANLGTNIQNGILLAIDDQNAQGGVTIAGQNYMLNAIIRDTKFDVVVSKSVAEELVFIKGVKVIAGPFVADAVGAQVVTEKNKVILIATDAGAVPGICGPNKPYSFFIITHPLQLVAPGVQYIKKFYPEAKTVFSMGSDIPGLEVFFDSTRTLSRQYGLDWLGCEKFPLDTKDFMPVISRALAKNPDIIDGTLVGGLGAGGCLLMKQLREAGFNGLIWCPTAPPPAVIMEAVPEKYRTRIITNDIVVDSPIISQAYKDMYQRYVKKFGMVPLDLAGEVYSGAKAFFEFLDGQDTMDTTAWMEGFAKYHWQSIFGREAYWIGKPIWGINRGLMRPFWVTEWIDGKPETRWEAPVPWDLFVEQN